eukprot:6211777-Pleurochrysis_carterae.AAC.10
MRSKVDVRQTRRRRKLRQQRRQTQTRIRNWQTTRKLKYDGKNRRKYRNKEAEEAINRESGGDVQGEPRREEENARGGRVEPPGEAGICQQHRGGSNEGHRSPSGHVGGWELLAYCWLWAVAGALGILEGKEGPTDKDIRLEREWRGVIRDTVRERGIPMTEDDINGLNEGVQYEQGRLIRGGTWGGGTEHQALAIILNINIVIWDRRHIGKVGAQHKQTCICSPIG